MAYTDQREEALLRDRIRDLIERRIVGGYDESRFGGVLAGGECRYDGGYGTRQGALKGWETRRKKKAKKYRKRKVKKIDYERLIENCPEIELKGEGIYSYANPYHVAGQRKLMEYKPRVHGHGYYNQEHSGSYHASGMGQRPTAALPHMAGLGYMHEHKMSLAERRPKGLRGKMKRARGNIIGGYEPVSERRRAARLGWKHRRERSDLLRMMGGIRYIDPIRSEASIKAARRNPWVRFYKEFLRRNPELRGKRAMAEAAKIYRSCKKNIM